MLAGKQSIPNDNRYGLDDFLMNQQNKYTLTPAGLQFYNFITIEVNKFCSSKRLNEASIHELDKKI